MSVTRRTFLKLAGSAPLVLSVPVELADRAAASAAMRAFPKDLPSFSGIYPHLAFYNDHNECGVGAVVVWADRLWAITYGPHFPFGSTDKLYEIDDELRRTIRPESIGGTHANRMIHTESGQLFMGLYAIDEDRNVRVISPNDMPGRLTGTARHLTDPEQKIYFASMEEGFYEVDVDSLAVKTLNLDGNALEPVDIAGELLPGYHGKGLYTGQNRLVYANNGERTPEALERPDIPSGSLAAYDGESWEVVRRNQFTEVTGPGGISGNDDSEDAVWSYGWDHRSAIFMLLDGGTWRSFRMPKASHTYDGAHGWHTEWPRIRDIGRDDLLMTMHGMFWDFPKSFSSGKTGGVRPRSSYLKIIGDFCSWNGKVVFGCDDAARSAFSETVGSEESMVGQSNSNLWFVDAAQLDHFGPAIGRGGPWVNDAVAKGEASEPFHFAGFDRSMVHIRHDAGRPVTFSFEVNEDGSDRWRRLEEVNVPPSGYAFHVFDENLEAEWIRARADIDVDCVTLIYQMADRDGRTDDLDPAFSGLARPGEAFTSGIIRPRGEDTGVLQLSAARVTDDGRKEELGYYEVGPDMKLRRVNDPEAHRMLKREFTVEGPLVTTDNASVVMTTPAGGRYRLPKGPRTLRSPTAAGWPRPVREIVTERSLFQSQGHIYELPRDNSGGFAKIRPVATSDRPIMDLCSWRGLLVIAGLHDDVEEGDHVVCSEDGQTVLWFGTIDDLWQLGKPRGEGGPWKNTAVQAGEPSDPYLMTGYDRKRLTLSHDQDEPVCFTVEVDLTGDDDWAPYDVFEVPTGQSLDHDFPEGFNAYWVRIIPSETTRVTAQLRYS